ncbi:bifunctional alpha/beta hydrolase/OsmC family protein [Yoonia sp. MH D7]
MKTERFTFDGHGGHALSARLDMPDGLHLATAIFAHCFTCSKDITAARRISTRLTTMGYAVLRFDFTGLGHSEGEFENTSFSSNVADLMAAHAALCARDMTPTVMIGHSLGGAAVLKATAALSGIKAVVTIGAPADVTHVVQNFADALPKIKAEGAAKVDLGGRPFTISQDFVDDLSAVSMKEAINTLHAALLVLHAPRDAVVGVDNAQAIFVQAKHPKSFISLDDADHLVTRTEDAEYVADVIAAWARKYLPKVTVAADDPVPEGVLRVTEADADGFLQDIRSGDNHYALADEPVAYGGTNKGMSPYGFLSAALGACTSMTIRMYARRKKMALTHVRVDISHSKSHAQDAETSAKVDVFERRIHLEGDLSEKERARLLEIADKCPVHRTLEQSSRVNSALV